MASATSETICAHLPQLSDLQPPQFCPQNANVSLLNMGDDPSTVREVHYLCPNLSESRPRLMATSGNLLYQCTQDAPWPSPLQTTASNNFDCDASDIFRWT